MISQSLKLIITCLTRDINIIRLFFYLCLIVSLSFCNSPSVNKSSDEQHKNLTSDTYTSFVSAVDSGKDSLIIPTPSDVSFQYDLEKPDERYLLPEYLAEISGIAYYSEERILCEQDENGVIYVFNPDKKKIVNKYQFGHDGDYEDIAVKGQTAYILRSDGHIFEVKNFDQENRIITEHKTPLTAKNDSEGLTYDESSKSLLIACKGSPEIKNEDLYKGYKAVFRFDLFEMKLKKEPAFLVDLNNPACYIDANLFKEFSLRIARKKYQLIESEMSFHPSGIAIHPVTDDIYMISSIGKILVIMNRHGKILKLHHLNTRLFRQPEGICFTPSGDLFISSEGDGGRGYILKFGFQRRK